MLSPMETVLIVAVVLLLFGAKKLPDLARSFGKSARILKSEAAAMKKDGQTVDNTGGARKEQAQPQADSPQPLPAALPVTRPAASPEHTVPPREP